MIWSSSARFFGNKSAAPSASQPLSFFPAHGCKPLLTRGHKPAGWGQTQFDIYKYRCCTRGICPKKSELIVNGTRVAYECAWYHGKELKGHKRITLLFGHLPPFLQPSGRAPWTAHSTTDCGVELPMLCPKSTSSWASAAPVRKSIWWVIYSKKLARVWDTILQLYTTILP